MLPPGCWRSSLRDTDVYWECRGCHPGLSDDFVVWVTACKFAFMATGSCPTRAERNSENLCPPALFREIPSCSVSLRRCVAVHKIAPPSGAPYTGARDPRPEIGGMNGWQPWVDAHSSRKLAPPRREDRFAAIVRRLRNVQVFPPNASRK
jgi:hypothetical protein